MNFENFCLSVLGMVPQSVRKTLGTWLNEDCGHGDATVRALGNWANGLCKAKIVAKEQLVLCGNDLAAEVFRLAAGSASQINVTVQLADGTTVEKGTVVLEAEGLAAALLMGERTALNLMSRLSGIATHTHGICQKMEICRKQLEAQEQNNGQAGQRLVAPTKPLRVPQLLETRKTTPGLKIYEKYATRVGGARNHRFALDSGAMLKENHFRACAQFGVDFAAVISRLKHNLPLLAGLEVEVTNLDELEIALGNKCEVVMLDNFSMDDVARAVEKRDRLSPTTLLELSGNLDRIDPFQLVASGVDLMSMGALIHQAKWVDLSLQFEILNVEKSGESFAEGRLQ